MSNRLLTYHEPTPIKVGLYKHLRWAIERAFEKVERFTPSGREQALALRKLEEALMWANKAVAIINEDWLVRSLPKQKHYGTWSVTFDTKCPHCGINAWFSTPGEEFHVCGWDGCQRPYIASAYVQPTDV